MVIAIAIFLFCVVCILYNSEDCAMLYFPEIQSKEEDGQSEEMQANEQEQQIYKYVSENVGITTAQAMKLLGIKQRRTREILVKMVENGWLRKEGASRSTIYVKDTEAG